MTSDQPASVVQHQHAPMACCDRAHAILPAALLLDLDDTILATSAHLRATWLRLCAQFADRLPGYAPDAVYDAIAAYRDWYESDPERMHQALFGVGDYTWSSTLRIVLSRLGIAAEGTDLADELAVAYLSLPVRAPAPLPEAIETLHRLRAHGVRLALLTAGRHQRQVLAQHALEPFFDCIVIAHEFGQAKPHASVYRHALAQLHVAPSDAWMVGDNIENDVAAPQRLGIAGVWVDTYGAGLPAGSRIQPHRIIRALADVSGCGPGPAV